MSLPKPLCRTVYVLPKVIKRLKKERSVWFRDPSDGQFMPGQRLLLCASVAVGKRNAYVPPIRGVVRAALMRNGVRLLVVEAE